MEPDDLYGLPLDEFIARRGDLAKALRKSGRRDEAGEVAALRKPSVAAWAVNQLVRTQHDAVADLFAAGDQLRGAQSDLLDGSGDGRSLRTAGDRERTTVDRLVEKARGLLSSAGNELSPAIIERVADTLHAAALDEDAREQVRHGRLVQELRHVGLGFGLGEALPPAPAALRRSATGDGAKGAPTGGPSPAGGSKGTQTGGPSPAGGGKGARTGGPSPAGGGKGARTGGPSPAGGGKGARGSSPVRGAEGAAGSSAAGGAKAASAKAERARARQERDRVRMEERERAERERVDAERIRRERAAARRDARAAHATARRRAEAAERALDAAAEHRDDCARALAAADEALAGARDEAARTEDALKRAQSALDDAERPA